MRFPPCHARKILDRSVSLNSKHPAKAVSITHSGVLDILKVRRRAQSRNANASTNTIPLPNSTISSAPHVAHASKPIRSSVSGNFNCTTSFSPFSAYGASCTTRRPRHDAGITRFLGICASFRNPKTSACSSFNGLMRIALSSVSLSCSLFFPSSAHPNAPPLGLTHAGMPLFLVSAVMMPPHPATGQRKSVFVFMFLKSTLPHTGHFRNSSPFSTSYSNYVLYTIVHYVSTITLQQVAKLRIFMESKRRKSDSRLEIHNYS